jgi:predicted nuclease with TOPRIM domain
VKYAKQSAQPFAELLNEADTIQARLQVLKTEIHQLSAFNRGSKIDSAYSQKVDEYNRLIDRYNALADKGDALGESLKSGHKK